MPIKCLYMCLVNTFATELIYKTADLDLVQ